MFELLELEGTSQWDALKQASTVAAIEMLTPKKRHKKNPWITEEIVNNIKERKKIVDRRGKDYRTKAISIRLKCRDAKESWLNEQCSGIESVKTINQKEMYDRIKSLSDKNARTCSSTSSLKMETFLWIMKI